MQLDRVTITGADDSIEPESLLRLSQEFPFVEWGILASQSKSMEPRYPSPSWVVDLQGIAQTSGAMQLSLHICGKWARQVIAGTWTPSYGMLDSFQRVQLNVSNLPDDGLSEECTSLLGKLDSRQFVFQQNDYMASCAYDEGIDAAVLYDRSGGKGELPESWEVGIAGIYHGYAGGLGPDNLAIELPRIAEVAKDNRIWIDMETRVRSDDDKKFDLDKVRRCLEICQPFITNEVLS